MTGYHDLVPIMRNHEKDRHVLAAAVMGRANIIVTYNLVDFPAAAYSPYDIEVKMPDAFLCDLWTLDPAAMAKLLRQQAAVHTNPPTATSDPLRILSRSAPQFGEIARQSALLSETL